MESEQDPATENIVRMMPGEHEPSLSLCTIQRKHYLKVK